MSGMLITSGLGVLAVGLVACANFLERGVAHGLSTAAAIAVLGAGAVLALIGGRLLIKAPSASVSTTRLLFGSVARPILVMALICVGIALHSGPHFAFDMARVVGQAFPVVVAIDLIAFLGAVQAGLVRTRQ